MDRTLPRVLKKGSAEAAPRCAEEILASAQARSRELLAEAEGAAAGIRAAACADALQARATAVEEGHAEGRARAAALLALATEAREARLAELDSAVVEVALEVARRILGRELTASPGLVVDVARRALRAASGCGDIVLRAAPADLEPLVEADGVLRRLVERGSLAVVEDPGLARGEVVVEASGGRVDARIDAQLDAFRRALQAEAG